MSFIGTEINTNLPMYDPEGCNELELGDDPYPCPFCTNGELVQCIDDRYAGCNEIFLLTVHEMA